MVWWEMYGEEAGGEVKERNAAIKERVTVGGRKEEICAQQNPPICI